MKDRPVMKMDERAAMYMSGPPDGIEKDLFTDGPTPYSLDIIQYMNEGDVLVGKSRSGKTIFREQLVDGKFVPWKEA